MKTGKLNFDDFRENQLSVIGQKSIKGGLLSGGGTPPIEEGDGTPPNGTPPSGGIPTAPLGNIKEDGPTGTTPTDPVFGVKIP